MAKPICVIPARGGSKRIPRKNIRPFRGRPMLGWSVAVAQASGLFGRIVVSTDDPEIAETAIKEGAEVPFFRPAELADDFVPTLEVVRHTVLTLAAEGCTSREFCCLYATAPLLEAASLKSGLETLRADTELQFVFSAAAFRFPIFRALREDAAGRVSMFWPEHEMTRSQDQPSAFHDAGQFYWGTAEAWSSSPSIFSARAKMVVLPAHRVQDIDTPEDWKRAELLHATLQHD